MSDVVNTDDAPVEVVIDGLIRCYLSWQPDVRVLGNVRSKDAVRALAAAIAAWNRRAPSADIEALRQKYQADMHQCIADVGLWAQKSGQLEGERDAVAIAFQKLSAVLRVNMLRWVPGTSHGEIDAAIDACLGPVARRVLSDHIPDTGKMVAPPVVKDCLTTQAAFAAGAAEMRERAAEQVDCGCSWRADALAATNKGERFVACGNDPCGAIEARAIRALPLPAGGSGWMPIETAPIDQEIDIWVARSEDGHTYSHGYRQERVVWNATEAYWEGERTAIFPQQATHWQPLPAAPEEGG